MSAEDAVNRRRLARSLGDYVVLRSDEPDFMATDALALGLLAQALPVGATDYYSRGFQSVCRALALDRSTLRVVLSRRRDAPLAARQLARLRLAMSAFADEWGSFLEGDLWGARQESDDAQIRMAAVREWYQHERSRLLEGVALFDAALLPLLGWGNEKTVSLAVLRQHFDFPEPRHDSA